MFLKRKTQTLGAITLIALIIGIGLVFYPPRSAKGDSEQTVDTIPNAVATTQAELQDLARQVAIKNGLNVNRFLKVQSCEIKKLGDGSWDYTAQSDYINKKGIREDSWGAWQIHLTAHPEITKEQAQDPVWATNWASQEWVAGRASSWSCWSIYYS